MKTDIEISQNALLKSIDKIAKKIWINKNILELYGYNKAKINNSILKKVENNKNWKLILVTAVNPTPAWEWKTTTTIWLWDAMWKIKKKCIIALREPSLWPVMWLKWWATGWWYAQVVPMEDINLHFNWDFHAITSAHLLLSATIDNHIYFWNNLNIDTKNIIWKRAIDVNDRALRSFNYSPNWKSENEINSGFTITTASEIMAILCLSENLEDLKNKLSNIIFAYDKNWNTLKVKDLGIQWAMATLLKDAIKPNLVQTLENNPCIIHGWPFANIAHGCNSLIATKLALKLSPYVVTEAWFWADLWAEKFFDIKCRLWWLKPDLVVIVVTIKSIKYNAWVNLDRLHIENTKMVDKWFCNLEKHVENMKKYNLPIIVCLNRFASDSKEEIKLVAKKCEELNVSFEVWEWFTKWWKWMVKLAKKVIENLENTKENKFKVLYDDNLSIKEKIEKIVTEIYGWSWVDYSESSEKSIDKLTTLWFNNLPVCIAKTPYSFSDNPKLLWKPRWFRLKVNEVKVSSWAWFIVVICGEVMTMPWLSKVPNATKIDIDKNGVISWLS